MNILYEIYTTHVTNNCIIKEYMIVILFHNKTGKKYSFHFVSLLFDTSGIYILKCLSSSNVFKCTPEIFGKTKHRRVSMPYEFIIDNNKIHTEVSVSTIHLQ